MVQAHIIDKAVEKLRELTGIDIQFKPEGNHKNMVDGIINIGKKPGIDLDAEVKNEIREAQIPGLINQMNRYKGKFILVSRYIPGPVKDHLKNEGVNYLETSGNCFISINQLFVYINDQKVTPQRETGKSVLWNAAGLRFVFALLQNPDILNQPYREIAISARVALGTVGKLIENLKNENFLKEGKRNGEAILFLERKEELLNRWTTLYNTTLRPKQIIGRFKSVGNAPANDLILPPGIFWGGEPAGARLTKFLTPEKFTLYTSLEKMQVMKMLKLAPDPNGSIELLNIFWNNEICINEKNVNELQIVPPLIVYADLLGTYDSRNYETADRIKNKYFEK
jgi:hypothetical protein